MKCGGMEKYLRQIWPRRWVVSGERDPGIHWLAGWAGLWVRMSDGEKRNISYSYRASKSGRQAGIAHHYTDWANPSSHSSISAPTNSTEWKLSWESNSGLVSKEIIRPSGNRNVTKFVRFEIVTAVVAEFCLVEYNTLRSVGCKPTFRKAMSPPSSGSKIIQAGSQHEASTR
jgi:hypothetical protein